MKRMMMHTVLAMVLGTAALAAAATEVKMTGDARIHGTFFAKQNFTGWNTATTRTIDEFAIWQRFRLRTDFIANENLKFRFGIRANNTAWGNGTYTVDNPAVAIDVYQAYLQFKWPGTNVEFSIGMQDCGLPVSSEAMMNANPVFGGARSAAAIMTIPVVEQFKIVAAYSRLLDTNRDMDPTTTQVPDEFDAFVLALPITLDGFKATPWGVIAIAGRNANYATDVGYGDATLQSNLFSAGTALAPAGLANAQNVFWWIGGSFAVTALDPFKFYADVIYGTGNNNDRGKNKRGGFWFDVAAEYTGLDLLTPQLTFWWSTGENSSMRDGSERLPTVMGYYSPSNSFLFDGAQAFSTRHVMNVNPVGSWGLVFSLNKISFIQDLTHRLTVTYARGNNSSSALRNARALWGNGQYVVMGRDLTQNEYVAAINFDHQYSIFENLTAIVETGWAHGEFENSVWTRRVANMAKNGDAFKVAFGLQYRF